MKMKTLVPLLLASLAIPFLAFSQNRTPTRNVVSLDSSAPGHSTELEKNITILLKGKLANETPVDLALTGCGVTFRSQVTLGYLELPEGNKIPITGSIDYGVKKSDALYVLQYAIGLREPIPNATTVAPGGAKNTSIGYEDRLITGTVKCEPGTGIDVFRSGDSILTLTVAE